MPTLFAICRATAVAALGLALYGAATLASAASAIQNPGSRVSLNPQPLPPRQGDAVMQSTVSNVLKGVGQAVSNTAKR
jgi:hypothetical protein